MDIHCLDLVASHLIYVSLFDIYWMSYLDKCPSSRSNILYKKLAILVRYLSMVPGNRLIKYHYLIRGVSPNSRPFFPNLVNLLLGTLYRLDHYRWLITIHYIIISGTLSYPHIILVTMILILYLINTKLLLDILSSFSYVRKLLVGLVRLLLLSILPLTL
jgi:hypothetical protein